MKAHRFPLATFSVALVVALTACGPGAPTAAPTGTPTVTTTPAETPTSAPTDEAETVEAAVVVVTATTLSVFGTDGSTLLAVDYEADAAAVAAQLADALGTAPGVSTSPDSTEVCPTRTFYDFGGLVLGTPQSLGSPATAGLAGTYDVVVTTASIGGIPVETVAGQRVGAERAAFAAAIGDEAELEWRGSGSDLGFDIVNPAADLYDQIGTYAGFDDDDILTALITPALVRFVGSCA